METLDPSPMISQAHRHLPQLQRLPAYPLRRLLPSPCTNASTQHASIYRAPATPRSQYGPQATRKKLDFDQSTNMLSQAMFPGDQIRAFDQLPSRPLRSCQGL